MAAVFVAFIVIGLAMPVLPLHVHQGLGLGTFLADLYGLGTAFGVGMLAAVGAAAIAAAMLYRARTPRGRAALAPA